MLLKNLKLSGLAVVLCAQTLAFGGCSTQEKSTDVREHTEQAAKESPPETEEDISKRLAGAAWIKKRGKQTLDQAWNDYQRRYRVRPDARFLKAMADVQTLISGQPAIAPEVRPEKDGWGIYVNQARIGTLPEFPDFAQQYSLLKSLAATLCKKQQFKLSSAGNTPHTVPSGFAPSELLSLVKSLNREWSSGKNTSSTLDTAATILVRLKIQTVDVLQSSDPLSARALSMLALCEASGKHLKLHDKALLADKMQYWNDARSMASLLKESDPARLYILQDDLSRLATKADASDETKFLYLSQLSRKREAARWRAFVEKLPASDPSFTLPVLVSFADSAGEESLLPLGNHLISQVNRLLGNDLSTTPGQAIANLSWTYRASIDSREYIVKGLLSELEENLKRRESEGPGLIDRAVTDSYFRANFYSGIALIANSYLSLPSTGQFEENFRAALKVDPSSPSYALKVWFNDRLALRGKRDLQPLKPDLKMIASAGNRALIFICRDAGSFFEDPQPAQLLSFGNEVWTYLDSRPETRDELSGVAESTLLSLNLKRRLVRASVTNGTPNLTGLRIRQLSISHNAQELKNILKREPLRANERLQILSVLEDLGSRDARLFEAQYLEALSESPDDWNVFAPYFSSLIASKKFEEAELATLRWIGKQKSFKYLDEAKARTALAQSLYLQRKYAQGLKELGKVANTEQYVCLTMKSMLLEKLGREDEAEIWAEECLKRYAGKIDPLLAYVELLWRHGKYSEAAKLISANKEGLSRIIWRKTLGPSLISSLGKDMIKCKLAVGSLRDADINGADNLGQVAHAAYEADLPELAFGILSDIHVSANQFGDALVTSYRYLKRWKGPAAAMEWLNKHVTLSRNKELLAEASFLSGQYELLWEFIPVDTADERIWILRAAAVALTGPNARERATIRNRFKRGDDFNSKLGRYLIGQERPDFRSALLLDADQICRGAFFTGWKELTERGGFFRDTDWYRVSIETGAVDSPEYNWSWIWLQDLALALRHYNKETNDQAMDNLRVVKPKGSTWDSQRRFTLSDF